jgi:hypothetical protein
MSHYTFHDPDQPHRSNPLGHAGVRVGAVGGIIMIGVHLFLLLINGGENRGDVLAWLIQLAVYFFAARIAAEQHYNSQRDDVEHLRGVRGAGVGAALVTSFIIWLFIIFRGVFRDALGITVIAEPISLFCLVVFDVLLAWGLGAWGGGLIVKKYGAFTNY